MNTSNITFRQASVFTGEGFVTRDFSVEDGIITDRPQVCETDGRGMMILPGLVDAHTHGRMGTDFVRATEDELAALRLAYARIGVTTPVPTLASATVEEWEGALGRIDRAGYSCVHLEGRYLSHAMRGIHREEFLTLPSFAELDRLLRAAGRVHLHITLAPELEGAQDFIAYACKKGCSLGIGHTGADYDTAKAALAQGAVSFTHLFNAMPPFHHRKPGPVGCALEGKAWAEVIADGFHMHPATVGVAFRCLRDRLVLVSDSLEAAGCPDGQYSIAGETVYLRDGKCLSAQGVIGGSVLDLPDAVRNLQAFAGATLPEALACATLHPASMLGLEAGTLEIGKKADFLITDSRAVLQAVYQNGVAVTDVRQKSFIS